MNFKFILFGCIRLFIMLLSFTWIRSITMDLVTSLSKLVLFSTTLLKITVPLFKNVNRPVKIERGREEREREREREREKRERKGEREKREIYR